MPDEDFDAVKEIITAISVAVMICGRKTVFQQPSLAGHNKDIPRVMNVVSVGFEFHPRVDALR